MFEVALNSAAYPDSGPQTLTIMLQSLGPTSVPVTILLLQGAVTIASFSTTAPVNVQFQTQTFELTEAQINRINPYANLNVLVTTATPTCNPPCATAAYTFTFTPSGIQSVNCQYCAEMNAPVNLTWQGQCFWAATANDPCTGDPDNNVWQLRYQGSGLWSLIWSTNVLVYQVTNASWDCQSALTLAKITPSGSGPDGGNYCKNYPPTITITPV
jgi:hypothetical protein